MILALKITLFVAFLIYFGLPVVFEVIDGDFRLSNCIRGSYKILTDPRNIPLILSLISLYLALLAKFEGQ